MAASAFKLGVSWPSKGRGKHIVLRDEYQGSGGVQGLASHSNLTLAQCSDFLWWSKVNGKDGRGIYLEERELCA